MRVDELCQLKIPEIQKTRKDTNMRKIKIYIIKKQVYLVGTRFC